ncbi:MAG: PAS domain S-box protein [Desulfuromonadaceae bacterium]|nr:PAS domain S-box protein [Desulfuromonadaceae bacterium]
MQPFSLKTKVTVFFPLIVTTTLFSLLFFIQLLLQGYIKESISNQQYQLISNLADEIDLRLSETHRPLLALAGKISPGLVSDPNEALAFLLERTESTGFFDNGVFLFDAGGRMVAELPLGVSRSGMDFSYREYLKATFATKSPIISDPYISSQPHHHPAILLTAPIMDSNGTVIAVLGGSIDLMGTNFLGGLSTRKVGHTGYMFLFDTKRMMIIHPDQSRVMKHDIPVGANLLLDRAIDGFNGSGETVNSRGLATLTSFKRLKSKEWIIGANLPLSEAYMPVKRVRNIFLLILPVLLLSLFLFMRRYLKDLTAPFVQLTSHVEELSGKEGDDRFFLVGSEDESATLGRAFNELIRETDRQRLRLEEDLRRQEKADAKLQRQNEYLQALHETTLGLIKRSDVIGLLQAIVLRAGKLVGTEHCYVYLKNAAGTEMDMMFQSGIYNHLHHYPIKPGEGIAGLIWNTGKLFHVDNYSQWEGRLPDHDREVLRTMAGVPLKSGEEVVGVLGVAFVGEGITLNDEQLDLLVQFGELASLALENVRLNDEFQRELAERVKAEANLRKLSVAVEQSPVTVVITDTSGSIEYVNPHFTALTGYTSDEAIGQNPRILKTGETTNEEYRLLWQTILAGGEWRGEFHNRKKDGELYWEQAMIAPIRDESDTITHFIAIKVDITERKQLEGQLRYSQKMDAIGQLAGGIAHDFNNILTAIVGYASILQIKLPDESPLKKYAEQIAATSERGASLTQGLLAFSRKQASDLVSVDLNEIISRVHPLLLRLIDENITLELGLAHYGLPVLADSAQIERILMNLTSNARDALPHGGTIVIKTSEVKLDTDFVLASGFGTPGRYAILSVADNGEGIDPDVAKRIFEPFYTTREMGKGTGLGLSVVYGIVKKHKGFIRHTSTSDFITVFEVYLPLLDLAPAVAQGIVEETKCTKEGSYLLLADDNKPHREHGRKLLEEFGYSIIEANDCEDMIEKFRENSGMVKLVIIDVHLPKLNMSEICGILAGIDPDIRVLFSGDYEQNAAVSQGILEEGMKYLSTSSSPKELLMKIREVLDV